MNEREALLRAICDNPDDDTPRLVFADWLQEHGEEERAEFVRLQVRHTELLRYASSDTDNFARQARELWVRHGSKWLAELPQIPGIKWHDAFFRGFSERAIVSSETTLVKHADIIFNSVPIRHLEVGEFNALKEFTQLLYLRRLKTLTVGNRNADESVVRRLIACDQFSKSMLLMVCFGNSGHQMYSELRTAFGEQLHWPHPPPRPARQRRPRR